MSITILQIRRLVGARIVYAVRHAAHVLAYQGRTRLPAIEPQRTQRRRSPRLTARLQERRDDASHSRAFP